MIKPVQSTRFFQGLQSGPQVQVIGIPEDDTGIDFLRQLTLRHGLYTSGRADGHEDRRRDSSVIGLDETCAGGSPGIGMLEVEAESGHGRKLHQYSLFRAE